MFSLVQGIQEAGNCLLEEISIVRLKRFGVIDKELDRIEMTVDGAW